MTSRRTRVRSTVAALLISLISLWAFAGYVTVRAGLHLWSVAILDDAVGQPMGDLVTALQVERRVSVVHLAHGDADLGVVTRPRSDTDRAVVGLRQASAGSLARWASTPQLDTSVRALTAGLDGLTTIRSTVDRGGSSGGVIRAAYTGLIDDAFRVYDQLRQVDDATAASAGPARARELLAEEDSAMSGMLAAGKVEPGTMAEFTPVVGTWRTLYAEGIEQLSPADRPGYDRVAAGSAFHELTRLEKDALAGAAGTVSLLQWRAAVDQVLDQLGRADADLSAAARARMWPRAMVAAGGVLLVIALGFVAIFASLSISIITTRRLRALRDAADELALRRLPGVVERLGRGETVDVAAESPPLEIGRDEIGQVAGAFNRMQQTAVRVAIEQAELRRGVRDVFLSLARRSQALLHRQLGLLDTMERGAATPDELAELFRVDHLATRMRRNAENLIVLSGATAGRIWRKPVPMVDVMRAALAEVEDYSRVTVVPPAPSALIGPAVGDIIHLLAELVENAVSFSPPQTGVRVTGGSVGDDFVIEVEDRGLGMSETQRSAANNLLLDPSEFALTGTARLGLFVVGRIATRHGIRVVLRESPYGGTTAAVTLRADLITDAAPVRPPEESPARLAPIGARPAPRGPSPSEPAAVAPSGLPVRRRRSPVNEAEPTAAVRGEPAAATGRATPIPLPGMSLLDGIDGVADGQPSGWPPHPDTGRDR